MWVRFLHAGPVLNASVPEWPNGGVCKTLVRVFESHPMLQDIGSVAEWLKALVLKTSDVKASVGSNPTLSVRGTR